MKQLIYINKIFIIALFLSILVGTTNKLFSQCQPYIKIDGNKVLANQTVAAGLALPYWLKENQTLAVDQMVNSISVIEFNVVNGNSLEFSQVLSITSTTPQQVPTGKVWKIESISKQPALSEINGAAYSDVGTYTFIVPSCASYICVEVWGGGGGGGGGHGTSGYGGGGGGGGGYGKGCFSVTPGDSYTVIVGSGGAGGSPGNPGGNGSAGGTSSVGSLISATGGNGGGGGGTSAGGSGGTGGTSTGGIVNISGGMGENGGIGGNTRYGGKGGNSGSGPDLNGGMGGAKVITNNPNGNGNNGSLPGGGGSGGYYNYAGGIGAPGRVIITW